MGFERSHVQAAALSAGVAFATAAAGCSGSRMDKAGGSQATAKPVVLELATHDDDYAHGSFAAAVAKLSGGSMRIKVATNWRSTGDKAEIDYERGIVTDVRSGKVPLGIVGVRVWDTMGVPAFRALLAPFLIESLNLEGRAIETTYGRRALASVSRRGVVGVALLPGPLRRPFGFTRALVRPGDFRGATIGIRPGGVAKATFAALGGSARGFLTNDVSGLDGAELDLLVISEGPPRPPLTPPHGQRRALAEAPDDRHEPRSFFAAHVGAARRPPARGARGAGVRARARRTRQQTTRFAAVQ
jgi:TRAP-type C4-dicarboxylate transport system substrate-binding protein